MTERYIDPFAETFDMTRARLGVKTLDSLLATEFDPLAFIVDDILPVGLTVVGGKPKIGKSWLMYGLADEIAAGEPALGQHATHTDGVLYLALEDSDRRMQSRARLLGVDRRDVTARRRLDVVTSWASMEDGGMEDLKTYLDMTPTCRLVLIDTWQRFRGDAGSGRNQYAEDYKVGAEFHELAKRHEIALVLSHHLRKLEAEDWIDRMSGSAGITGAADTIWGLFRERGQHDATLRITGRDVFETDVALRQDGVRWKSLGNAEAWRTTEERRQILELLIDVGMMRTSEVAKEIGKSAANVSKLLHGLADDGLATSPKRGWWKPLGSFVDPGNTVETVDNRPSESTVSTISTNFYKEPPGDLPNPFEGRPT